MSDLTVTEYKDVRVLTTQKIVETYETMILEENEI